MFLVEPLVIKSTICNEVKNSKVKIKNCLTQKNIGL